MRDFELVLYEESLSILPPDLQAGLAYDDKLKGGQSEMIILDHMENSKGLENLIVMCIGLDEPIGTTKSEAAATRARLYRGITRAQVQAIVINEHISGGWLEFLGFFQYKPAEFEESKALQETNAGTASQVISARPEGYPKKSEKNAILTDALRSDASESENQENKTSAVNVTTTVVWDTDDNDLNTDTTAAIQKLMFDPREDPAQVAFDEAAAAQHRDIFWASLSGDLPAVRQFMRRDPTAVAAKGGSDQTALHYAARSGHLALLEFLLAKETDVDARTSTSRETPLHLAATNGHVACVKLLPKAGAQTNARNDYGATPGGLARGQGHDEIVRLLAADA